MGQLKWMWIKEVTCNKALIGHSDMRYSIEEVTCYIALVLCGKWVLNCISYSTDLGYTSFSMVNEVGPRSVIWNILLKYWKWILVRCKFLLEGFSYVKYCAEILQTKSCEMQVLQTKSRIKLICRLRTEDQPPQIGSVRQPFHRLLPFPKTSVWRDSMFFCM